MCGIAGAAWTRANDAVSADTMASMLACLEHRGPDAGGQQSFGSPTGRGVRLGHRRLSILDLSEAGRQPMQALGADVWLTFNGEVYNFRELRDDLRARGHRFRSDTDSEVLLAAYLEYGDDCLQHFRGMFALAIVDLRGDLPRLLLARDRLGQKPLHYAYDAATGQIVFASELKALLAAGVSREIDPQALALYLTYQYVPHPHSILRGCRKLSPATRAVWQDGVFTEESYWSPPFCEPVTDRTPEDWRDELRATLTESVRLRMRSDVPIGAFLSGGIDSSITAGLMQSLSPEPIHTFSIGFPDPAFDETSYANEAAAQLGTRHHVERVDPSAMRDLRRLVYHYDEPFGDSSALPTTHVSHFARQFVTVALSGDGGDELFCGYERYRAASLAARLDHPLASLLWRLPLWRLLPKSGPQKSLPRRARRFAEAMGAPPADRYLRWISHFDPDRLQTLLSPAVKEQLGDFTTAALIREAYDRCDCRDLMTQTACADVHTYLPCDILTKVDLASMSASLECRSPFLDHRVAELAARMPVELKVESNRGRVRQKAILIDTFADLLPERIQRRSKMGFGVPIGEWFRGELRPLLDGVLLSERCLARGLFEPSDLSRIVGEHHAGRADHRYRLWTLLLLELWHRAFLDGDVPLRPAEVDLGLPADVVV